MVLEVVRTSIDKTLLRWVVLRGSLIAAAGLVLMLLGNGIPASRLAGWGAAIILLSLALITLGLLPYRRLMRLQLHPNELTLSEEELLYTRKKAPPLWIGRSSIATIRWLRQGELYGIAITLHPPATKRVDLEREVARWRRLLDCDLFLPYFSKESCRQLENFLSET